MANINCDACDAIREESPSLIVNGLGDTECASLQNNTGLNPSSGNDDCEDLNNLNDCLVGNMAAEIDSYDVCDWKTFMKKFIPNVWTTLKGIICAICGLWTRVNKHDCEIANLYNGISFDIGEEPTDGSYVVAGKGVSFYQVSTGEHKSDVGLTYIAGGLAICYGSCRFYSENFTDEKACVNFDNGSVERTSIARLGNPNWAETGQPISDGELIFEIRIKKSEYPEINRLFRGNGMESSGGAYRVHFVPYTEGVYAPGQHGGCYADTGEPYYEGSDRGHLVPTGWIYVQCRMFWIDQFSAQGGQYTPYGWMGIRTNRDKVDC